MLPGIVRGEHKAFVAVEFPFLPSDESAALLWDCGGRVPSNRGRFIEATTLARTTLTVTPQISLQTRRLARCLLELAPHYPSLVEELHLIILALSNVVSGKTSVVEGDLQDGADDFEGAVEEEENA